MFKSGFISIIGRPNVGKSTLMNALLGVKLAITSDVAQTTRNTIQGIYTNEHVQMIFMDTPGIHRPQDRLGTFMNKVALTSVDGADIICFLAPCNEVIGKGDRFIINRLKQAEAPIFLVLTKVDTISKEELIQKITSWKALFPFQEVIPVSAKEKVNLDTFLDVLTQYLPEGHPYYSPDQMTDHPERFIMAEFIREKILYFTYQEIPHDVAIVIERMKELEDEDAVEIMATIICNRPSQKGMLVGKQGAMIKKITQAARRDMKRFLGCQVYLECYVRVERDWRNKTRYLKEFGYNEDEY